MAIHFGTSGWRAIMAEEFTYANVCLVTKAICDHIWLSDAYQGTPRKNGTRGLIVIGHDSRFGGEDFANEAIEVVTHAGLDVLACTGPTPTPAISHAIRHRRAMGGINFTASHNPYEYNGLKFSTADGAPAPTEITREIEKLIGQTPSINGHSPVGQIERFNTKPPYFEDLKRKIRFDHILKSGISFAFDPLWGAGRGYLDQLLREHEIKCQTIHDWRDVLFGGHAPEPNEEKLKDLKEVVLKNKCGLGLATDGDADRFGILDSNGAFILPNKLIPLLCDYLVESRGWTGGVARSVATSALLDRVAESRGLEVYETPVGFKHIGQLINEDKIIIGGEESAGLTIKGHYPEKDGILACLLAAEAVAVRGISLSEQLTNLYNRVGHLETGRIGVALSPEIQEKLVRKLARDPESIGRRKVKKINRIDGVKFTFSNGAWILLRPSGTEPLVRIYAESESAKDLEELLDEGRKYLLD